MFSFFHPRPVIDARPVAEQAVRQVQPDLPALTATGAATHRPSWSRPPIRFTVDYGLREYVSVVQEHLSTVLTERGLAHKRQSFGLQLMLALLIPPVFLLKRWRIGRCRFEINGQQLTRRSRGGVLIVPWQEVVVLHAYSGAYLVSTPKGAMPLPYRCFSANERLHFEAWTAGMRTT